MRLEQRWRIFKYGPLWRLKFWWLWKVKRQGVRWAIVVHAVITFPAALWKLKRSLNRTDREIRRCR